MDGFLLGLVSALWLGILISISPCPLATNIAAISFIGRRVGTALPVIVFAVLIALGTRSIGTAFNKITQIERWARRITGVIFLGVGIYFSLAYIFGVL